MPRWLSTFALLLVSLHTRGAARAQPAPSAALPSAPAREASASIGLEDDSPRIKLALAGQHALRIGGYLETYYAYNFNRPRNRITELRAFDNRHDTLALQAAILDFGFEGRELAARVVAQLGTAAATYYGASEPQLAGSPFTPASGPQAWQYLQQAWLAYSPLPQTLTFDAGVFLSPIGPESMPTYQNHHWSHSLLFFGLPFYHAGARIRWQSATGHSLRAGVYNGWNNVLDNNAGKTLGIDYTFNPDKSLTLAAVYFVGPERATGAPEGNPVRHLLDLYGVWQPLPQLTLLAEADGGIEPNHFGLSRWLAGNISGRLKLHRGIFVAARASVFAEHRAKSADGEASPIAIPVDRIASGTLTFEVVPLRGLSVKLETRYDRASAALYFDHSARVDALNVTVPDARDQLTWTVGASAWF